MTRSLRPYQIEDVGKLLLSDCSACFNEQRTGKTPIAIMTMKKRQADKVLIVCPTSMIAVWRTEWKAWTGVTPIVCQGPLVQRKRIIDKWEHGPLIISYNCIKSTNTSSGSIKDIIDKKPDACIADEAHHFKDPTTKTALAMYALCKHVRYRLALTGTPATNKPTDIFGILKWLYPDTFNSYWKFIHTYFKVVTKRARAGKTFKDVDGWLPGKQEEMVQLLNEFSTQRKRKDVMQWLPDKDYLDIKLPATREQKRYLNELDEFFETEDITTAGVLDRLIRIRQICVAPGILKLPGSSPKIDWVFNYCKDYPDKPIIVFSKFIGAIDILHKKLMDENIDAHVITGSTPPNRRAAYVKSFQDGYVNILLLQIDAGKEGLTLDRAEAEIFIDQFPPAADIQQAEDRFVATTEERKDKPHTIIRLILEDTYDEEIYKLVESRAESIDVINSYINYINKKKGGETNGMQK